MDKKIIIIGTGVFGCSTVNHVTKRWPSAEIHVISRPSPNAPSDDISKIVRTDYTDEGRTNEAIAADLEWKSKDNLKPYQRTTGRVVIYDTSEINTFHMINNIRKRLGRPVREKKGAELMEQHFGANIETEGRIFTYNSDDRIVDWKPCMDEQRKDVRAACESSGGGFYETGVTALDHQNGRITTIILEDERTIKAEDAEVILAAGPWVLQIMDESVIPRPPLNRSPVPTGLFSFHLLLNDLQVECLGNGPALSYGRYFDWVPPASGSNTGKITWTETFTTTGDVIKDMSGTDLTTRVLKNMRDFVRVHIPPLIGAKIKAAVNQWDAVTPTQDPLIDKHPDFINLTVATGGSFNRAKDLPTIGSHILAAVENKDVPDLYRWHPNKLSLHQIHPHLVSRFKVDKVKYSQGDEDLGEI